MSLKVQSKGTGATREAPHTSQDVGQLKSKTLMISNAGEDMKQKELSVTAGENAILTLWLTHTITKIKTKLSCTPYKSPPNLALIYLSTLLPLPPHTSALLSHIT